MVSPPAERSAGLRIARVVEPSDFRLANSNYKTNSDSERGIKIMRKYYIIGL